MSMKTEQPNKAPDSINDVVKKLRGQLQNCVNYLERAKRKHPHDDGNYCVAIEEANRVLYETRDKHQNNGDDLRFVQKLDTNTPGIFVFRIEGILSVERQERSTRILSEIVKRHSPGSSVLLLPGDFGPIEVRRQLSTETPEDPE